MPCTRVDVTKFMHFVQNGNSCLGCGDTAQPRSSCAKLITVLVPCQPSSKLGTSSTSVLRCHALEFVPKSVTSEICKSTFVGSPAGDGCASLPLPLVSTRKPRKDDSC
jgi:hypothetical protein